MKTGFKQTEFLVSAASVAQAPADIGAEVAFAGRSNAGKSSAINAITGVQGLAHVSKTPGRTQLLNFFRVDGQRRLVDLPGYGYARVPEAVRLQWGQMIEDYLAARESLRGLVLLMDIRHPLTDFDHQLLGWCRHVQMPVHVLLTKADKLKRGPALSILARVKQALTAEGQEVTVQLFSAQDGTGLDPARAKLRAWLG